MGCHEQRIQAALLEIGCDQSVFSAISGISQSKISNAFKGVHDFSIPELQSSNALVTELREIAQSAAPFPVNFRSIAAVRHLLEQKRGGVKWSIAVQED